jgi:7-cyano-7-deazaguanine synthase
MVSLAEKDLIIMSGGLDSTTLAYKLQSEGRSITGIYLDVGDSARVPERNAVRFAANNLGISLEIVVIPGLFDMFTGFYPSESFDLGEWGQKQPYKCESETGKYIIGFHVLISIASYYAQLAGIKNIYSALTEEQYNFTPGLKNFSSGWQGLISPLNPGRAFTYQNPFAKKTKAQIIRIGSKLGVQFEDTWSCHFGRSLQCGKCSGCISRKDAFAKSGIPDPTRYEA